MHMYKNFHTSRPVSRLFVRVHVIVLLLLLTHVELPMYNLQPTAYPSLIFSTFTLCYIHIHKYPYT